MRADACDWGHVAWPWQKQSLATSKLIRNQTLAITFLQ